MAVVAVVEIEASEHCTERQKLDQFELAAVWCHAYQYLKMELTSLNALHFDQYILLLFEAFLMKVFKRERENMHTHTHARTHIHKHISTHISTSAE